MFIQVAAIIFIFWQGTKEQGTELEGEAQKNFFIHSTVFIIRNCFHSHLYFYLLFFPCMPCLCYFFCVLFGGIAAIYYGKFNTQQQQQQGVAYACYFSSFCT